MKMLEKLQKRLHEGKKDNKGFSLVELIIVIAIMAILVGIVGTQIVPYLNRSRVEKDRQLLDSYSTAAVTAYAHNVEKVTSETTLEVKVYGSNTADGAQEIADEIKGELVGYTKDQLKKKMSSTTGKKVSEITITYDFTNHTVTVHADDTELEDVKSDL